MRVNLVLPNISLSGGIRVALMFAEHLHQRGHRVFVVSPAPEQPRLRSRVKALLKGQGWLTTRHDLSYLKELRLEVEPRVVERHRAIEDRDLPDADVVIATWWATAEWVARLSPTKGAKAYFIQGQEFAFSGQPAARVEATWRLPMQKIIIARWLADIARDQFADPTTIVVNPGVDFQLFNAPPRAKQKQPTVGFLYSPMFPGKGTATALAAIAEASTRIPGLHVRAFGTEEVLPSAMLPPRSEFTRRPPQEQIRTIYAGCDAWLCSSTTEGFHLPPLEAMACRCPVVSTRVGGPTDLIEDGVNGYLVDIGDTAGLADRMVRVLSADEAEWRRMSDAAYATATRFTWKAATDQFERALQATIERYSRPGG
jgi:glycosyltransferase involved in cell wall biosynthesis